MNLKQFVIPTLIILGVILAQIAIIALVLLLMIFTAALLTNVSGLALFIIFFMGAFTAGLPLASAAWAWEDMRHTTIEKRTRYIWCAIIAVVWIPGLALYFIWRSRKGKHLTTDNLHLTELKTSQNTPQL